MRSLDDTDRDGLSRVRFRRRAVAQTEMAKINNEPTAFNRWIQSRGLTSFLLTNLLSRIACSNVVTGTLSADTIS